MLASGAFCVTEFIVTERANQDLINITMEGYQRFGVMQSDRYQADLDAKFGMLAAFPHMGRRADSIRKGLRRHEHGSHVIFYREEGEGILIIAVVHAQSLRGLDL